jgi:hypothetical protein
MAPLETRLILSSVFVFFSILCAIFPAIEIYLFKSGKVVVPVHGADGPGRSFVYRKDNPSDYWLYFLGIVGMGTLCAGLMLMLAVLVLTRG